MIGDPRLGAESALLVGHLEDGVDEEDVLAVDRQSGLQHFLLRGPVVDKVSINLE